MPPGLLPLVKPALKATFKSGVALYERAKIAIAETAEVLADVAAEARTEVQADLRKKASLTAAVTTAESALSQPKVPESLKTLDQGIKKIIGCTSQPAECAPE